MIGLVTLAYTQILGVTSAMYTYSYEFNLQVL
jgi:hypothetical protein